MAVLFDDHVYEPVVIVLERRPDPPNFPAQGRRNGDDLAEGQQRGSSERSNRGESNTLKVDRCHVHGGSKELGSLLGDEPQHVWKVGRDRVASRQKLIEDAAGFGSLGDNRIEIVGGPSPFASCRLRGRTLRSSLARLALVSVVHISEGTDGVRGPRGRSGGAVGCARAGPALAWTRGQVAVPT